MSSNTLTDLQFADFSNVIRSHLGIKMPDSKKTMIQGRLFRRVRELEMESLCAYHAWFFSHPGAQENELQHLLDLATTNKTDFFREASHFDFLTGRIVPEWRDASRQENLNIWSAGCSSGEEPYSIAMTMMELQERSRLPFTVWATDVSTRILRKAIDAVYAESHAENIPPALRGKYLLRSKDRTRKEVRIAPEVRSRVRFGVLNFLSEHYAAPFRLQVIFFRNVMIYFDRPTQEQVVSRMCEHLLPGGYFFTGHSESLNGLDLPLQSIGPAVYRKTRVTP